MLLEIEADLGKLNESDSLADRVLDNLITYHSEPTEYPKSSPNLTFVTVDADNTPDSQDSDYVRTLLRDPTSSHLLETVVRRLSDGVFEVFWNTYLHGQLARVGAHPVANFVVGKALERVNQTQLEQACEELEDVAEKLFRERDHDILLLATC